MEFLSRKKNILRLFPVDLLYNAVEMCGGTF